MKKPYRHHVFPCAGPKCGAETGARYKATFKDLVPDRKALGIRMSTSSCQGMCELGPNVAIYPEGVIYHRVCDEDIPRIVQEHLREGRILEDLVRKPDPRPAPPAESEPADSGPRDSEPGDSNPTGQND